MTVFSVEKFGSREGKSGSARNSSKSRETAFGHHFARLCRRDFRHRGVGCFEHLFDACGHGGFRMSAGGAVSPDSTTRARERSIAGQNQEAVRRPSPVA